MKRATSLGRLAAGMAVLTALAACTGGGLPGKQAGGLLQPRESARVQGYYKVGAPYEIDGVTYVPAEDNNYDETGIASWYGPDFHGKITANGELYDMNQVTAAHKTLPMPCLVRVTNLDNGRQIIVRVNDRGPYARGRILDMSRRGAQLLGYERVGTAKVRVQIMAKESMILAEAAKQGKMSVDIAGLDPDLAPPLPPGTPGYTGSNLPPTPQYQPNVQQPIYRSAQIPQQPLPPARQPQYLQPPQPSVALVDEKTLIKQELPKDQVKGADVGGRFLPTPTVAAYKPVKPTGIFIQAGAFGVAANAEKLRAKLGGVGKTDISTAIVNGQTFYRVRVGPVATVDQADALLARVVGAGGNGAKIIVN